MAKYYDLDNDTRINGKLTVNGDTSIPSSNLFVGGNITGNIISGNSAQITTINGTTANITNVNSTGTISGGTLKGDGSALTVNGTTANGGTVPISNGWAYTHENKTGSQGHIPTGGSVTTFLRGDNTWVTPTDSYVTGLSSTAGGNGTLTVTRNNGNLTIDLSHNHNTLYLGLGGGTLTGGVSFTPVSSNSYIASVFSGNAFTYKSYINFNAGPSSNDPGYIMHETSSVSANTNNGVIHLAPTDDNARGDYVSIHGSNDPETIKIHTDGYVETPQAVRADQGFAVGGTTVIGNDALIDWARIKNEPTTYAPSAHTHLWADITDKPTTFTPSAHTHLWADITDKPTTFTPSAHTHLWADLTDKPTTFTPSAHTHLWADITDKPTTFAPSAHNHDDIYYTETEMNSLLSGKDYYGKWNLVVGGTANGVTSSGNVTVTGGGATTVSYATGTLTISSTDTNTWRAIDTSPVSANTANSIASSWAYAHINTYGLGAHVPSGGSATTFLRGDNTWVTPTDTNTFVTGLTSTAGGNGTMTVTRNTGGNLTIDLSHTHSQYVANNSANQVVQTGFTMSGNAYVGGSSATGALVVRGASGASAIQLAGDNSTQQAGVTVYMNASGNANFSATVSANTIKVASTGLVSNLNAEMLNGLKESKFVKNITDYETGGMGVYSGCLVVAQTVPNMTVLVASGIAYTDSGLRVSFSNNSVALSTASATFDRKDVVYIQGSSANANEGTLAVAVGTPSATPVEPSIPFDAIKLAVVSVPKNIGSIQSTNITDARVWKPLYNAGGDTYLRNNVYVQGSITSTNGYVQFAEPLKTPSATSVTISKGSLSATWTHNLNIGTNYAVRLSVNSPEPHVYWSSKLTDKITVNLGDVCENDVIVDISLEYY